MREANGTRRTRSIVNESRRPGRAVRQETADAGDVGLETHCMGATSSAPLPTGPSCCAHHTAASPSSAEAASARAAALFTEANDGSGAPSAGLGLNNEVYLDLDSFKVHTKSAGSWSAGSLFKGSDGSPGQNGLSLRFGSGSPLSALGVDNEVYLDLDSFKVHKRQPHLYLYH